jgi:oleate hydratase
VSVDRHAWLVGGGIASLAAAALLIRDGGMSGDCVHVLEQSDVLGGSLDGAGSAETGYVIRGGRMFEPHYVCTYDLFANIPALDGTPRTVACTIRDFTAHVVPSSKCRLVRGTRCESAPPLQLTWRDRIDFARLLLRREAALGDATIEQYFRAGFLETNFWLLFSTMFAFQPWHSLVEFRRYMLRFLHLVPGLSRLEGIDRTALNQYDSLVRPLVSWLEARGVELRTGCRVVDLDFDREVDPSRITALHTEGTDGSRRRIAVGSDDVVFVTLGSMIERSTLGAHDRPACLDRESGAGAWALWRRVAAHSRHFGRPDAFCTEVARTKWLSFTVTLHAPDFFAHVERFTGNAPGTGGVLTLVDSPWRLSIVLAHQPHFANQPAGVEVFWGYGLFPDRAGDHVRKPMDDCTGAEILRELAFHLGVLERHDVLFGGACCIPCQMPYVTSQFMPRLAGDRPEVVPARAANFAFLGQFCEVPRDTVFTVEYSVRTAQTAVYGLLGLDRRPLPVHRSAWNSAVLWRAVRATFD